MLTLIALATRLNSQTVSSTEATTLNPVVLDETTLINEVDSEKQISVKHDELADVVNGADPTRVDDAKPPFEGLQLEEAATTKKAVPVEEDLKNIYKVNKNKLTEASKKPVVTERTTNVKQSNFRSFEVYKQLFDQSQWSWNAISKVIQGQCATDMQMYLDGLSNQVRWAMQGKLN